MQLQQRIKHCKNNYNFTSRSQSAGYYEYNAIIYGNAKRVRAAITQSWRQYAAPTATFLAIYYLSNATSTVRTLR